MSNDTPLMQMLGTQMRYASQRQGVLAQNIANVDTPKYKAQDLKKPDFAKMAADAMAAPAGAKLAMAETSSKHIQGTLSTGAFTAMADRDGMETSPTGNSVSLDDQMAKISDTGTQFQIASTLMKKFTTMYRAALGNH